ncbi:MAG: flavin reductase family protein, partial [Pseudomonadota bacterium]
AAEAAAAPERAPVAERAFRDAMAAFPTGVTIVCADDGSAAHGLTVASFSSLSLEPPQILICVRAASPFLPIARAAGGFAVHVLARAQKATAEMFAGGDAAARAAMMTRVAGRPPRLEGALARFECGLAADHPGGDHRILIGEVKALERAGGAEAEALTWWRSRLDALAPR